MKKVQFAENKGVVVKRAISKILATVIVLTGCTSDYESCKKDVYEACREPTRYHTLNNGTVVGMKTSYAECRARAATQCASLGK